MDYGQVGLIVANRLRTPPLTQSSPTSFAPLMEDIARQCQAAVVFPYYTAAPTKQFPFQFEQTYGVLDHIVRNSHRYNLTTKSFALAGDSVGGTLIFCFLR
jgi:acetyl esterase